MKTYQTLEDVSAMVADFHGKMKALYEELAEGSRKEQAKMLLEYLRETEKRFEEGLKSFAAETDQKIEETWTQYLPEVKNVIPEDAALSPNITLEEAAELALDFYGRLAEFYRKLGSMAGAPPGVKDVFRKLAEQQEQEKKKLVKVMHQIHRMP